MDFTVLKQNLKEVTKKAFLENLNKYGKDICGFALVSDDGAMTVVPFTNTLSHLQKMQAEDPKYKEVYEFEPAEWLSSDGANEEVNQICQLLHTAIEKLEGADFDQFKNELFETCVIVLEELQTEKFFGTTLQKDIPIIFSISDTDEPKENLIAWNKRTNSLAMSKSYENYQNIVY